MVGNGSSSRNRTRSIHVATHLVTLGHPVVRTELDALDGRVVFIFQPDVERDLRAYFHVKDLLTAQCAAERLGAK